jgi:hypothetical protein
MDEAGISENEPFCVVAAVVVHSDRQIKPLEHALSVLADECAPPEKRDGFVFHALELYNGGRTLERGTYPREYGRGFLQSLVNIPADNGMDVAMHFIEKATLHGDFRPETARERQSLYHAMAFIGCAAGLEMLMRSNYPGEVCQVIAEDNTTSRALIRQAHAFLSNREQVAGLPDDIRGLLPFEQIVHATFFAEKREAPGLQLADAAAFSIRRHLEGRADAATYYDPLIPALINRPKTDSDLASWDARRLAARSQIADEGR